MPDEYDLKDDEFSVPPPLPVLEAVPPGFAPMPPPIPAQALAYPSPWAQARPGIITAIGVISIIVASISAVSSIGQAFTTFGLMAVSKATSAMARAQASSTPVLAAPPGAPSAPTNSDGTATPEIVGPNGLGPEDRQVVEDVLTSAQPLDEARKAELDHYLARDGQSMFPTAGRSLTARQVKLSLSRNGATPDGGKDDPGHTYFVTGWGTLNIYDDKAIFTPRDRSQPAMTTSVAEDNATPTTGPAPLSTRQINRLVSTAQSFCGNAMDQGQVAAFKTAIQDPNRELTSLWVPLMATSATTLPDGSVMVTFNSGSTLTLGPNGAPITSVPAPMAKMTPFVLKGWLCALCILEAVLSAALAIYLFIAGIQVMRQSPAGARLHWIYVAIKIPLTLLGGIALIWLAMDFGAGVAGMVSQGGAAPAIQTTYAVMSAMAMIAALIYPIALLFALRSQTVRQYYNSVQ